MKPPFYLYFCRVNYKNKMNIWIIEKYLFLCIGFSVNKTHLYFNKNRTMKYITRGILNEYLDDKKVCWFKFNKPMTYNIIQNEKFGDSGTLSFFNELKKLAIPLFHKKGKLDMKDAKEDINTMDYHNSTHTETMNALKDNDSVVWGGFVFNWYFTGIDMIIKNGKKYDLVLVKGKNNILKDTKENPLNDDLTLEIELVKYVFNWVFGADKLGKITICHLNKEYVRKGEINPKKIFVIVNLDEITVKWKDTDFEQIRKDITTDMEMKEDAFNIKYPYEGQKYLYYFGEVEPDGSVFSIPWITRSKKKLIEIFNSWNFSLKTLKEDILTDEQKKFINLYRSGETTINKEMLKQTFDWLKFPLYFYDYETVGTPIPLFDKTYPYQNIVVQYSIDKMNEDGSIKHNEYLIEDKCKDIDALIDSMSKFLMPKGKVDGTFIVWNKTFETKRNEELAEMYPKMKKMFEYMNENTFDLMDVFSNYWYYMRGFGGGKSLKVIVPKMLGIDYQDLPIKDWMEASNKLVKVIMEGVDSRTRKELLQYNGMDTMSMVWIYKKLKEMI